MLSPRILVPAVTILVCVVLMSCTRQPHGFEMDSSADGFVDLASTGRPVTVLGVCASPLVDVFPDAVAAAGENELRRQVMGAWQDLDVMGSQALDARPDVDVSRRLLSAMARRGYLTATELAPLQQGLFDPGYIVVARLERVESRSEYHNLAVVRQAAGTAAAGDEATSTQPPDSVASRPAAGLLSAFPIEHHRLSVDVRLQIYDPSRGSCLWDGVATESIEQAGEESEAVLRADRSLGRVGDDGQVEIGNPARDQALVKAMAKGIATLVQKARTPWTWDQDQQAHPRQMREF